MQWLRNFKKEYSETSPEGYILPFCNPSTNLIPAVRSTKEERPSVYFATGACSIVGLRWTRKTYGQGTLYISLQIIAGRLKRIVYYVYCKKKLSTSPNTDILSVVVGVVCSFVILSRSSRRCVSDETKDMPVGRELKNMMFSEKNIYIGNGNNPNNIIQLYARVWCRSARLTYVTRTSTIYRDGGFFTKTISA